MRGAWIAIVVLGVACWKSSTTTGPPPNQWPVGAPRPPGASVDRSEYLAVWPDNRGVSANGRHQAYAARMRVDGSLIDPQGIAVDTRPRRGPPHVPVSATTTGWWVGSDLSSLPTTRDVNVSVQHVDAKGQVGARIQVSDGLRDTVDFDLVAAGNDVLVAWAGVRRTKTEAALIVGDRKIVIALPPNTGRRPAVTYDPVNDNYVLVYREANAATCLMIDRGGAVRTSLSIPGVAPFGEDGVRVAATGSGEVLATWVESDARTVTAARIDVASAQITARATLRTAQGTMMRHRLVRGQRGFVVAWLEQSPRGQIFEAAWLDGADPLGSPPRAITLPITRPDAMPEIQAGASGFLVTWSNASEPYTMRIDGDGAPLDAAPVSLRGVKPEPVPSTALQASLDVVDPNGADYCPQRGHDRSVPPTVRGLYVVEGPQPWGTLYIPGFGWGGSTGSSPRRNFYVGRGLEFVPHFPAGAGTAHPFELTVEIPDAKRKRTERIKIDHASATTATAAGITGPLDLVDVEVNNGLGGKGLHFVITKAKLIEDARVLAPRFTAARAEFDKLVKASRKDLDRVIAEAKRAALAANPYPQQKGNVPRAELVIYMPTYRPTTGHIEVLFGYRVTDGVMMKFPPPKPDTRPHKHAERDTPLPNPRPLNWAVIMGARIVLDGDKIVAREVWTPTVVGVGNATVPWECRPVQGHPSVAAKAPTCSGPPPTPAHTCIQNCGPPVVRTGDPPPGWSWASPAQVKSRRDHGCPICLPAGARVATPEGDVDIASLQIGARILTIDEAGRRVPATVLHVGSTLAGAAHRIVRVELADGRVVAGSPGHPRAEGGTLGDVRAGDALDGARVTRVEHVPLGGEYTWDILPSGSTGLYIIDGVVLKSSFTVGK